MENGRILNKLWSKVDNFRIKNIKQYKCEWGKPENHGPFACF